MMSFCPLTLRLTPGSRDRLQTLYQSEFSREIEPTGPIIYLSIYHLSIHLSSVYLCIHLSCIYHLSIYLLSIICLSIIYLSLIYLSIYHLSIIYLSIYHLSTHLSIIYLPIYLSIYHLSINLSAIYLGSTISVSYSVKRFILRNWLVWLCGWQVQDPQGRTVGWRRRWHLVGVAVLKQNPFCVWKPQLLSWRPPTDWVRPPTCTGVTSFSWSRLIADVNQIYKRLSHNT